MTLLLKINSLSIFSFKSTLHSDVFLVQVSKEKQNGQKSLIGRVRIDMKTRQVYPQECFKLNQNDSYCMELKCRTRPQEIYPQIKMPISTWVNECKAKDSRQSFSPLFDQLQSLEYSVKVEYSYDALRVVCGSNLHHTIAKEHVTESQSRVNINDQGKNNQGHKNNKGNSIKNNVLESFVEAYKKDQSLDLISEVEEEGNSSREEVIKKSMFSDRNGRNQKSQRQKKKQEKSSQKEQIKKFNKDIQNQEEQVQEKVFNINLFNFLDFTKENVKTKFNIFEPLHKQ